ncbi:MAG: hypothetical protein ABII72_01095 [Parcubacteria group bacterium]
MAETRPYIRLPKEDKTSPLEVTQFDRPGSVMDFEDEQKAIAEVKTAFGTTPEEQEKGYQQFMAEIEADIAQYEKDDSEQRSLLAQRSEPLRQAREKIGPRVSAFDRVLDSVKKDPAALLTEETTSVFDPAAISAQAEVMESVVREELGEDFVELTPDELEEDPDYREGDEDDMLESNTIAYEPQSIASTKTNPLGVRGLFSESDKVKTTETDPNINITTVEPESGKDPKFDTGVKKPDDDVPSLQELSREARKYKEKDPIFDEGIDIGVDDLDKDPVFDQGIDIGVDDLDKDPVFDEGVDIEMDDKPVEALKAVDASAAELRQVAETASNNSKTSWKGFMGRVGRMIGRLTGRETTALVKPIDFPREAIRPLAEEVPKVVRESEEALMKNLIHNMNIIMQDIPLNTENRRAMANKQLRSFYKARRNYNAEARNILEATGAEKILEHVITNY